MALGQESDTAELGGQPRGLEEGRAGQADKRLLQRYREEMARSEPRESYEVERMGWL